MSDQHRAAGGQRRGRSKRERRRHRSKDQPRTFAACRRYSEEFENRSPEMLQALKNLEESADQLDSMNNGAKVAGVVGSSLGAVAGVVTMIGLASTTFEAEASLPLIMFGLGLGCASSLIAILIVLMKLMVNKNQQKIVEENMKQFSEDVERLQVCGEEVEEVVNSIVRKDFGETSLFKLREDVSKTMEQESEVSVKILKIIYSTGREAVRGCVTLSGSAWSGFASLNVLLVITDIVHLCKDTTELVKGCKGQGSKLILDRVKSLRSLMDSLKKLKDSAKSRHGAESDS